jgi:hypothetical protein
MKGYPLTMFTDELTRVPEQFQANPACTFDIEKAVGRDVLEWAQRRYRESDTDTLIGRLPKEVFLKRLSFDQLCKYKYGRIFTMDSSVDDMFRYDPKHAIFYKIKSSMWRWGYGSGVWNEVVDAYEGIRRFAIPRDGFEIRLDFTTGLNPYGYSREADVFLDGVFGFLVYYKGEHVMTLGFSFMEGRRLLVQQVQLTHRKGNRFLFKLPANRVEFFLHCFAEAFPQHELCIADGSDIGRKSLQSYKARLAEVLKSLLAEPRPDAREEKEYLEEKAYLHAKIEHLTADFDRVAAVYANTGRFSRKDQFEVLDIRHYPLAA